MYAIFSEKQSFLTPWCAHTRVHIRGVRNVDLSENFVYVLNQWHKLLQTFFAENYTQSSMIKQWAPDCPCRLCRTYLHVGFIYLFFVTYFFKSTTNIMYLIRFKPMLLSCFVFRILAASVDTSRINCNISHWVIFEFWEFMAAMRRITLNFI